MLAGVERGGAEIEIAAAAGQGALPAYLALPAGGHGPGVLVLHAAEGLGDGERAACDRLAREGFCALAPDLFGGDRAATPDEAQARAAGLDAEATGARLEASVGALLGQHAVDGSRVGALGFGLGGHLALLVAARSPRVGAVVDCYGVDPGIAVDWNAIGAPVLALLAEKDEHLPPERVDALRQELALARGAATLHVQPGVGHGFLDDARPDRFDAAAAAACWRRLLAWLRAELS